MKKNIFPALAILVLLASCTWVEPTQTAREINVLEQTDNGLSSCKKLGSVTSMVKHRIGPFKRSADKVKTELVTLAKNQAAEMGGDTIRAEGPADNGRGTFTVYRCAE